MSDQATFTLVDVDGYTEKARNVGAPDNFHVSTLVAVCTDCNHEQRYRVMVGQAPEKGEARAQTGVYTLCCGGCGRRGELPGTAIIDAAATKR